MRRFPPPGRLFSGMVGKATVGATGGAAFGDPFQVGCSGGESAAAHRSWAPTHPPFGSRTFSPAPLEESVPAPESASAAPR